MIVKGGHLMELSELNKIGRERLNHALRLRGKNAADMCRATGLTTSSVSRYLSGQSVHISGNKKDPPRAAGGSVSNK